MQNVTHDEPLSDRRLSNEMKSSSEDSDDDATEPYQIVITHTPHTKESEHQVKVISCV